MKKIGYIKFILLFLSLLIVYYLGITHIDFFITNYENKLISYDNSYNTNIDENNIVESILHSSSIEIYQIEDTKEITDNKFIINLIANLLNKSEEETKAYMEKNILNKMVNLIKSSYYDSNIVYITSGSYTLSFTLDGKNIIYNKHLSGESCPINVEKEESDIEIVEENIKELADKLNITTNFNFKITSIRESVNERYYGNQIYYIEDYKHHIKIIYNLACNEIYSLEIGFKELLTK